MPKINLLPKELSEIIAAGEVVERPSSVVKELIENSIDAGAKHITLEISRGGILYIRITDDGCGISFEDVPTAFLRHATSKIKTEKDLESIASLGFRGEALAATSVVSRVELFTKQASDVFGTHYKIEGGNEVLYEENGCPDGTTIIVRDIFYNTPARMKFLKKDVTEGNSVAAVFECAALSHPEIAFKFIRDSKLVMSTSGDSKPENTIYSILGREIASTMISFESKDSVSVSGFVCKPAFCRKSRAVQYIFLNGRYVQSKTIVAACEQAYKNSVMVGKFPAFVLNVNIPFDTVDVNVHPAKTQVRFSDEKRIFDAVYVAVKSAILSGDTRPEIKFAPKKNDGFGKMSVEEYRQEVAKVPLTPAEEIYTQRSKDNTIVFKNDNTPFFKRQDVKDYIANTQIAEEKKDFSENTKSIDVFAEEENIKIPDTKIEKALEQPEEEKYENKNDLTEKENKSEPVFVPVKEETEIRFIGEAFFTYIIVEKGDTVYFIDKHAAHERINFNRLKNSVKAESQQLLLPVTVRLSSEEFTAITQNAELLEKVGFEVEDFGNLTVIVRAIPAILGNEDVTDTILEVAENLLTKGTAMGETLDRIYHTVSCKAAIKAGNINGKTELERLAREVLCDSDVMYCPHGRPVAFTLTKKGLEKQFGRIQ